MEQTQKIQLTKMQFIEIFDVWGKTRIIHTKFSFLMEWIKNLNQLLFEAIINANKPLPAFSDYVKAKRDFIRANEMNADFSEKLILFENEYSQVRKDQRKWENTNQINVMKEFVDIVIPDINIHFNEFMGIPPLHLFLLMPLLDRKNLGLEGWPSRNFKNSQILKGRSFFEEERLPLACGKEYAYLMYEFWNAFYRIKADKRYTDWLIEYEMPRLSVIEELCLKDKNNNPINTDNVYQIPSTNQREYNRRVEILDDTCAGILQNYEALLEERVDVFCPYISIADLPNDVDSNTMSFIGPFIKIPS